MSSHTTKLTKHILLSGIVHLTRKYSPSLAASSARRLFHSFVSAAASAPVCVPRPALSIPRATTHANTLQTRHKSTLASHTISLEDTEHINVGNMGMREDLYDSLTKGFKIENLFPIQKAAFGPALLGRDIVAKSRTGSGKTLAFLLPIAQRLLEEDDGSRRRGRAPRALIVTPTRELAIQAEQELRKLSRKLESCSIYGGASYGPQLNALQKGVDVVCATPGRLIDHLERGSINLSEIETIVLDEADRMLEIGFKSEVESILQHLPHQRQVLLFSATVPSWVKQIVRDYTNEPIHIDVSHVDDGKTPDTIDHRSFVTAPDQDSKVQMMADLIASTGATGRIIIFTKTKNETDYIASHNAFRGIARAIHGDIPQVRREQALEAFKKNQFRILVATDVAARGIDVPEIEMVFQTWFPEHVETYIHRSGRTGRAGRSGTSVIVHTIQERNMIPKLEKAIGTQIQPIFLPRSSDMMEQQVHDMKTMLKQIGDKQARAYQKMAEELLEEDPLAMSKILCLQTRTSTQDRSFLSSRLDMTAMTVKRTRPFYAKRNVVDSMYSLLSDCGEVVRVGSSELLLDGRAVIDVPNKYVDYVIENASMNGLEISETTPADMMNLNIVQANERGSSSEGGRFGNRGGNNRRGRGQGGRHSQQSDYDFGVPFAQHRRPDNRRGSRFGNNNSNNSNSNNRGGNSNRNGNGSSRPPRNDRKKPLSFDDFFNDTHMKGPSHNRGNAGDRRY